MIDRFKQNISFDKLLKDGMAFAIQRVTDHISYAEFLAYFRDLPSITRHHLIIGINFTYGWMPSIFKPKENYSHIPIQSR